MTTLSRSGMPATGKEVQTLKGHSGSVSSRDEDGAVTLAKIGDHATSVILIKIKKN